MKTRFSTRTVLPAAGAVALLCVLFALGRPLPIAEHEVYRVQLRELRVRTMELEQGILQAHLNHPGAHETTTGAFAALRASASQARPFPSFLGEDARWQLGVRLDTYIRALVDEELLLARLLEQEALRNTRRGQVERRTGALLEGLPPGEERARARVLTDALLASAEDERTPHMEATLDALMEVLSGGSAREALTALDTEARALLTQTGDTRAAFQKLVEHPATPAAEQLVSTYLHLHEQAQVRAERFRIALFAVSLLLAAFVLVVLWWLSRMGTALDTLNAELERRVEERTAALSTANAGLRESEARTAAILEGSLDGIISLDESGRILEFNPAAEGIFRLGRAEALGRDFLTLGLAATVKAEQRAQVARALRPDTSPGQGTRLELSALRTDGATFPAELTLNRVRSEGPPRFTAYVRDITERREVERMKNEFISTVSHELRTPLTSIRGSLGLLEGGVLGDIPEQALDMVRIARTNTERLIRLINDILDLEKMEAGMLELKLQPVESTELIEATFSGVRAMADTARVTLRSYAVGAGAVRADRDRLIQVLTNLVSNAIKFSPPDSQVEVWAARDARGQVRFAVADQGPGIPPDKRGRLFGKFQQLDSSDTRSKGGTGLGLAISQAIVEQHGGHIEVRSEQGQGATFSFLLPSVRTPSNSHAHSRVADDSRHSILVVTPDPELTGLLRGLLTHEGYRVLRCPSLEEAHTLIAVGAPDVLVLDAQWMENGGGLDFVRRLREAPHTRELPVLILTAREEGAVQPLLVDWMPKPFDEERFLQALRSSIRPPGQARVLIVEDDKATRQVLRAQLERLGVACFEAEDGEGALALARLSPPDLIVLDVSLPRLDGFEVVDILRQGKGRGTPLIVFTGRELTSLDQRQLTLGTTRHLVKSRTTDDTLMASVKELLAGLLTRRDGGPPPRKEAP